MNLEDVQASLKDFNIVEATQEGNSIIVRLKRYEPDKEKWGMINQICLDFGGVYEPQEKKPGLWRIPLYSMKALNERFDRVLAELKEIRAEIETKK